jgi:hypothetical protein
MAPSQKLAPFSLVLRGEGLGMSGGRLGSGWQLKLHTSFRANNAATPKAPLTLCYLCFLLFLCFSVPPCLCVRFLSSPLPSTTKSRSSAPATAPSIDRSYPPASHQTHDHDS